MNAPALARRPEAPPTAEDRAYCRAVLPRVSRTFAMNIRLLGGAMGESVRVAYLLCRTADALEDSWTGPRAEVEERFDRLAAALEGDRDAAETLAADAGTRARGEADLELVTRLPRVWRTFMALDPADRADVAEAVGVMARGMRGYAGRAAARGQGVPYVDDEAELRDYCWVVAGCVGVMLTRLFARRAGRAGARDAARRLELAPVVGEALQLTNILLDWPEDVRRGRCYVPAAWLAAEGLALPQLVGAPHPAIEPLAARLEAMARASLARVPDYLDTVPSRFVRYRLFCLWPALWALGSLAHARRDSEFPWGPRRPKLPRAEIRRTALESLFAAHHGTTLRRMYAAAG